MTLTSVRNVLLGGSVGLALILGTTFTSAQEFDLRFTHDNAATHPVGISAEFMASRVDELTGGRIKVRIIHGGAMGGGDAVLEAVQLGTLEMGCATMGTMSNVVPEFDIVTLPFLFDGYLHLRRVLQGPLRDVLTEAAQKKGFVVMAMSTSGARQLYAKKPVNTPADAKGMKIRVMDVPILVETWRTLGAIPTPIAFPEVYMAMQTGVVDGAESSFQSWINASHYEVAPYGMRMDYADSGRIYVLSEAVAKKLPEDLLLALRLAWNETEERLFTEYILGDTNAAAAGVKKGAHLVHPNLASFREALKPVYTKFQPTLGEKWIKLIQETKY